MRMYPLLVLSFMVCCCSLAEPPSLLPKELSNVYVGMDWRSFISVRKNVELLNMLPDPNQSLVPDPEKPRSGLTERFPKGSSFDVAIYGFEGGMLTSINVTKDLVSEPGRREAFLSEMLELFHKPTHIKKAKNLQDHANLMWETNSVVIRAMLPLSSQLSGRTKAVAVMQVISKEAAERKQLSAASENDIGQQDKAALEKEMAVILSKRQ